MINAGPRLVPIGIFFVAILACSYAAATFSPVTTLMVAVAFAVGLATLVSPEFGLSLIIISSLFSPELVLFQSSRRGASIRVEDFVLMSVTFTWLATTAIRKHLAVIRPSPLNRYIGFFSAVCIISSANAIMAERVDMLAGSLFLLKYLEYFFLFLMVNNLIESESQIRRLINVFLATVSVSAVFRYFYIGTVARVAGPLGSLESDESNTVAAYDVLALFIMIGMSIYAREGIRKMRLAFLALLLIPPFIFTLSRGGYAAAVAGALALLGYAKGKRRLVGGMLGVALIIGIVWKPEIVWKRVAETMDPSGLEFKIMGVPLVLDPSAGARIGFLLRSLNIDIPQYPLFGVGVAVPYIIDSMPARLLAEVGLLGTLAFILLIGKILIVGKKIREEFQGRWMEGLAVGYLVGVIALLVHGVSAATFFLIRPMIAFWLLTGLIIAGHRIEGQNADIQRE